MKTTIAIILLTVSSLAFAGKANTGGMGPNGPGSTGGAAFGSHASTQSNSSTGQGKGLGTFNHEDSSLVDAYQPWPEKEMRQYQKP